METPGQRKCAHCKLFFKPDPRHRNRQRHCTLLACRKVSKAVSQRRWLARPENKNWWRGPENVQHVQEWRKRNPGYWRRVKRRRRNALQEMMKVQVRGGKRPARRTRPDALQDPWQSQQPLLVGLIAHLTGTALQDDMAGVTRRLIARGEALLGSTLHDYEKNPLRGAPASWAGPV